MYERLCRGELLEKTVLAKEYSVTLKTIQRDIDELRNYFAENNYLEKSRVIVYSKARKGYFLEDSNSDLLRNDEIVALCKIILESRAFCEEELRKIIEKLLHNYPREDRAHLVNIINNELFHYVPLQHKKQLLSLIWELSQNIYNCNEVALSYTRMDGDKNNRLVKPLAIMFSEYYFYLIAQMSDESKKDPTVFRMDRIEKVECTGNKFKIPYKDKFEEGEFRKRVQFMFSGKLQKVVFEYKGPSIEAVLDKLPTAEIIEVSDSVYTVKAESYGSGIFMWIASQGDNIKILEGGA